MRQLFRNPFVWAFVVGCTVITLMRPLLRREPPPPPVLRQLLPFELVDASGKAFGSADLRGHVYVASFFFTRCPSICPTLMKRMAELQRRYREDGLDAIRLVSITVDPDYDTPERLREAESRYGVDGQRWVLLTGGRPLIRELAESGFQVPVGETRGTNDGLSDIAHTGKLMLVDGNGALRGYYDSDERGLDEAYWRSRHVLKEVGTLPPEWTKSVAPDDLQMHD